MCDKTASGNSPWSVCPANPHIWLQHQSLNVSLQKAEVSDTLLNQPWNLNQFKQVAARWKKKKGLGNKQFLPLPRVPRNTITTQTCRDRPTRYLERSILSELCSWSSSFTNFSLCEDKKAAFQSRTFKEMYQENEKPVWTVAFSHSY